VHVCVVWCVAVRLLVYMCAHMRVRVCDKIEKNEMGGACSTYGGEERRIQGFGGGTSGKETIWKTQA